MGPDWLGSPQHVVAGATIACGLMLLLGPTSAPTWLRVLAAIGSAALAESVWEIAEYALRYEGRLNATAYWDTVADLAATVVGAVLGCATGFVVRHGRRRETRTA